MRVAHVFVPTKFVRHEAIMAERQRYAALMADRPPTPAEAAEPSKNNIFFDIENPFVSQSRPTSGFPLDRIPQLVNSG
jgi:hypothetical protein